jgi:hypothetical protein
MGVWQDFLALSAALKTAQFAAEGLFLAKKLLFSGRHVQISQSYLQT